MSSVLIGYNVKIIISRREKKLTMGFFLHQGFAGGFWFSSSTPLATVFPRRQTLLSFPKNTSEKIRKIRIRS